MTNYRYIEVELRTQSKICTVSLNRPEKKNAQNTEMLYEIDSAFRSACSDDDVHVIILRANGSDFSAGHDLRETDRSERSASLGSINPTRNPKAVGQEGMMAYELDLYLGLCKRWRDLPKPTIAAVQGKCISGGLMLAWPCDIIVASEDATFQDNTLLLGIPGAEFFAHPWELGVRKAKEYLFTGEPFDARQAESFGMVNHVVAKEALDKFVLELAEKISSAPGFAVQLAKRAVNTAQDAQGFAVSLDNAFALHHLAHSHAMQVHGLPIIPDNISSSVWKK